MKKKHAFIVVVLSLLGIYFVTLAFAPDSIAAIGPAAIAGIVGSGGFSLGSNVMDNWQRSKYYRAELDQKSIKA